MVMYPVKEERELKKARKDASGNWLKCQDQTDEQFSAMERARWQRVRDAEDALARALGEFHVNVAIEAAKRLQ